MKKRIVAIALAAAIVMTTFAGCGGAEETVETQKSENTEKTSEDAVKNLIASGTPASQLTKHDPERRWLLIIADCLFTKRSTVII